MMSADVAPFPIEEREAKSAVCADLESTYRVMHVVDRWGCGGVQRLINDLIEHNSDARLDYRVLSICRPTAPVGDVRFWAPLVDKATICGKIHGALLLNDFLAVHRCDVVHIHTSNALGLYYAHLARRHGVRVRVVHSHNSRMDRRALWLKKPLNWLGTLLFSDSPTERWACSTEAGVHLFGTREFALVPNGVDIEKFRYRQPRRAAIREELGVPRSTVLIGSIGRLSSQKNPLFLLEVWAAVRRQEPGARFVLIGDGELRLDVERRVRELGLAEVCRLVSHSDFPEDYLCALDVFVAPSLFEGLPIALVEAQVSGVSIVASDTISAETFVSKNYKSVSLAASSEQWARVVLECSRGNHSREHAYRTVANAGFSIEATVDLVEAGYARALREEAP